jgi:hypothetical protein
VICKTPMVDDTTTRTPRTVGVLKLSSNVPTIGIETIPPTLLATRVGMYEVMPHQIDDLLSGRLRLRGDIVLWATQWQYNN